MTTHRAAMLALPLLVLAPACGSGDGPGPDGDTTPDMLTGRLETDGQLPVLHLWGTREELGRAEGALLCGRITRLVQDYVLDYAVPMTRMDYGTLTTLVMAMVDVAEGDEAEMRSMVAALMEECPEEDRLLRGENLEAEAGGEREIRYEDLVVASSLADWGCSSFTAWGDHTTTGGAIHGRNFDYFVDSGGTFVEEHMVKVYHSTEEGGARWVSVGVPGLVGCVTCFTEEGVGLTMHDTTGLSPSKSTGLALRILAARRGLVATWGADDKVGAMEAVLEDSPQNRGNNLHLSLPCDGSGCTGGVVFEFDGHRDHQDGLATVRRPGESAGNLASGQALACTNHYMSRSTPPSSGDSVSRYDTLAEALDSASGTIDAEKAAAMLDSVANSSTVHSVVMDTANQELHVYLAPSRNVSATRASPVVLDLQDLFEGVSAR